jgi:hypothetical protein
VATSTPTLGLTLTTDAAFRTWGQAIDAAITALGLVNTGDTGQVDLTTMNKPAGSAAYAGYKVYRFADALQATKPVFIKVEYGTSDWAASRGGLRITVGSGTNGAGTITGVTSSTALKVGPGNADPTGGGSHFAGDTGRLLMGLYTADANARGSFILIDRTRADDGTPNGDGLHVWNMGQDGNNYQCLPFNGSGAVYAAQAASLYPPGNEANAVRAADVLLFPLYGPPRISKNPCSSAAVYASADIAGGTQITVDPDGSGGKNFLTLGGFLPVTNPQGFGNNARPAVRFE